VPRFLCFALAIAGAVLALVSPLAGAALAGVAVVWAIIAGSRAAGSRVYRLALWSGIVALAINLSVLVLSWTFTQSGPSGVYVTQID
jgi:hypothetical protein